ncbi:MAG: Tol-Pal system protein TolB [Campylobacterota bacterium]|nr:Tol-Pal system protein TolB [Campylobacterota bacterium]
MKRLSLIILSLHFFTLTLFAVDATLKIETDVEQRSRISLVDSSPIKSEKVFNILLSDLKISGHFLPDMTHHQGDITSNFILPVLKGQEYVLKYSMNQQSGAKLLIRLLKASDGTQVFKKSYAVPAKAKMPFLLHKAVNDINTVLQYPDISWINRYVVYAVYTNPGRSEIRLADYTMTYKKTIIKGGLNLFPKWADTQQRAIYYTSYKELVPTLYKLNIYTGSKEYIASSQGMMVCSDVNKNGSKILLTMAPEGQADIFEMDIASMAQRRVTEFKGIDVNGRYVDDESRIVFISNRLGYANVFKKSIHSAATSQVVYHGRNNNACDAYEDKIVYSSRESHNAFGKNTFNLYLSSSGNSSTRAITTTGTNQFPRFSTDGSVILYLKQRGHSTSIGYVNLKSSQSLLFPFNDKKVQSIDW